MNANFQWFNRNLPMTLVNAQLLAYITAVMSILFGAVFASPLALLFVAGYIGGAAGIANEKKAGYAVAVTTAVLVVALTVAINRFDALRYPLLLNLMFDIALAALLLHPESRSYQRTWFR